MWYMMTVFLPLSFSLYFAHKIFHAQTTFQQTTIKGGKRKGEGARKTEKLWYLSHINGKMSSAARKYSWILERTQSWGGTKEKGKQKKIAPINDNTPKNYCFWYESVLWALEHCFGFVFVCCFTHKFPFYRTEFIWKTQFMWQLTMHSKKRHFDDAKAQVHWVFTLDFRNEIVFIGLCFRSVKQRSMMWKTNSK